MTNFHQDPVLQNEIKDDLEQIAKEASQGAFVGYVFVGIRPDGNMSRGFTFSGGAANGLLHMGLSYMQGVLMSSLQDALRTGFEVPAVAEAGAEVPPGIELEEPLEPTEEELANAPTATVLEAARANHAAAVAEAFEAIVAREDDAWLKRRIGNLRRSIKRGFIDPEAAAMAERNLATALAEVGRRKGAKS